MLMKLFLNKVDSICGST